MPIAPRQTRFLITFGILLCASYGVLTLVPVDAHVVLPFTGVLARAAGVVLNVAGEHVSVRGTVIQGSSFAVDIRGGCNGLEAVVLVVSAMLAFSAPWVMRVGGAIAAAAVIEIVNVFRVASLYAIGVHRRAWFETAHLVVWQTVMFALAVFLFVAWVSRFGRTPHAEAGA